MESERQVGVRAGDCDNASRETTIGTDTGDNTRGGEAWEADIVSTKSRPVIQCRKK